MFKALIRLSRTGFIRLVCLIVVLAVVTIGSAPSPAQAAVGFHISGRNLLDANNNNFIMRGISHAHVWYPTQTSSFANIKAAGANTVRVVLGGGRWGPSSASDVTNVINLCKTNKLICVLEDHDTTGFGEDAAATSLATAVNYWKSIQSVLTGQEAYVIINIGNEPYGNTNASGWIADTKNAIIAMRSVGFQHTLMVDAPNWGQDWQFIMRDNAASVFAADTAKNTIFSIHMYGVFDTAAEIQSYVSTFVTAGLPLVIGEFGWNHSDGNPDEDSIMATAQANGIGYLGWSWSGNGGGVEYLDMVTAFDPAQRTSWGIRIITGANGLSTTSKEASVYSGTGSTPVPSNTPTKTNTLCACVPSPTATRTPTGTNTPFVITNTPTAGTQTPGGIVVQIKANGSETNQQTPFSFAVKNNSSGARSGISVRVYFTADNGNAGSNYTLEKYYDQSGVAVISTPTLASGSTYYFIVNYGSASLAAGAQWEFQSALHLANWGTNYDGTNDWYHTGYAVNALPAAYTNTNYLPAYLNGTLTWGLQPGSPVPTNTMASTANDVPTKTNTLPPTGVTTVPSTTPTKTNTPVTPTVVPSATQSSGGTCSPVSATITAPFTFDGAGTLCWKSSNLGSYINSWNVTSLTVNGVNFTNLYSTVGGLPPKASDGFWYISYSSSVAWGHFEAK